MCLSTDDIASCTERDYQVLEMFDYLEEFALDPDDEYYIEARQALKGKRGAIVWLALEKSNNPGLSNSVQEPPMGISFW